ncbi:hypothetical protein ACLOJK_000529, partial [Asimina triloba]
TPEHSWSHRYRRFIGPAAIPIIPPTGPTNERRPSSGVHGSKAIKNKEEGKERKGTIITPSPAPSCHKRQTHTPALPPFPSTPYKTPPPHRPLQLPMAFLPFLLHSALFMLVLLSSAHASDDDLACAAWQRDSTLTLMHLNGPCSPFRSASKSWEETMLEMDAADKARLLYLASLKAGKTIVPIGSGMKMLQSTNYILRASVGTPPQQMLMALDIGNDAAWMPCAGCVGCPPSVFNSPKSTTFKTLGCKAPQCNQVPNPACNGSACTFKFAYGTSTAVANLSRDNLKLANDVLPNYAFGCLKEVTGTSVPPQGLIGLGRGPLSLLSQTQPLYHSTFSYCLPSIKSLNFTGSLKLGVLPALPTRMQFTPLLKNPRRPSLYFVNMTGISVGRKFVPVPIFDPVAGAGTVVDSGTMITRLVAPAYVAVRDVFRRRVKGTVTSLGGFDTCYNGPVRVPTVTFHFTGMSFILPPDNVMIHSTAGSISCLAMAAAPLNVNTGVNVIASMQQQNHRVVFDLPNSKLGVARELCT